MVRADANGLGNITNLEKMVAFLKRFVLCPVYGENVEPALRPVGRNLYTRSLD